MRIQKNGVSLASLADWRASAPPKSAGHWAPGRSAMECARAWLAGGDSPSVPDEIATLLASHGHFRSAVIESITPEHRVRFDRLPGEPRNADVVAVASGPDGLTAISIEAKADESFGRAVERVAADVIDARAHGDGSNMLLRIEQLAASILPPQERGLPRLGALRYQLLTAVAGALAYAAEQGAKRAIVIVHEFVTDATADRRHAANARDLDRFVARLSGGSYRSMGAGSLIGPLRVVGKPLFDDPALLYVGKAVRNLRAAAV